MNHLSLVVLVALLLTSCGGRGVQAAKTEPSRQEATRQEATKAGEVSMNSAAQQKAGIAVIELRPEPLSERINASGELTYNEDQVWIVGALLEGRVAVVGAKVGDSVRKGQLLAEMHSHDVHDARAAFKVATADLAKFQALEGQARRMRDRAKRLFDLKASSEQEVEMAESDLRSAQVAAQNAKTELDKEKVHITEFLQVPLEDDEHEKPGHADDFVPIKAPAAGLVVERKATTGTVVSPGDEVFRIANLSSLWMMASVNEADLQHLQIGQEVRILVRAYPDRTFAGHILRLGEQLDPTTRTLKVRVLVPNPGGLLKPQMYASAEIERKSTREALFVPDSASQDLNGHRIVFVRTEPERFVPRPIEVSSIVNGRIEVTAGLRAGDQIVTRGSFLLKSQLLKSSLQEE